MILSQFSFVYHINIIMNNDKTFDNSVVLQGHLFNWKNNKALKI